MGIPLYLQVIRVILTSAHQTVILLRLMRRSIVINKTVFYFTSTTGFIYPQQIHLPLHRILMFISSQKSCVLTGSKHVSTQLYNCTYRTSRSKKKLTHYPFAAFKIDTQNSTLISAPVDSPHETYIAPLRRNSPFNSISH